MNEQTYNDKVIAVSQDHREEVALRLADWTPHGGYTALVDAADRARLDLTEYSGGDVVAEATLSEDGEVLEFDPRVRFPDLPNGWEWRGGSGGENHYTHWFGTQFTMGGNHAGRGRRLGGFDGQVYHDKGGHHFVEILPIVGMNGDDPVFDYPEVSRAFDSKQEAVQAVPGLIESLGE